MAERIVGVLNEEMIDALITQTIKSGCSLRKLASALQTSRSEITKVMQVLTRRIGSKQWLRLICANGNISILTHLLRFMDAASRQEFVKSLSHLSNDQWNELLLRGDFAGLAYFVKWASQFFSQKFIEDFYGRLNPTFETLIHDGD
jgi:hypothetical protein